MNCITKPGQVCSKFASDSLFRMKICDNCETRKSTLKHQLLERFRYPTENGRSNYIYGHIEDIAKFFVEYQRGYWAEKKRESRQRKQAKINGENKK